MTVTINNNDVLVDLSEGVSEKSLNHYKNKIFKAIGRGCNKLILDFKNVNNFDNLFLDFIVSIKEKIEFVNFCNVNMSLLPAFYLMKIDQIARFYTSRDDALHNTRPIIKRRLGIVQRKILLFVTYIIVLNNIA